MSAYNFKKIMTVPTAEDFVNFTLSKTQRKTPTVVHKQYKIPRIRSFYMRKVKFTSQNFHDRITEVITNFPKLEDMHPFYSDLLNTLYNKDHYKLSLGQLNTAMHLIDKVSTDYTRLLKYSDSLYRCKQLKIAALGRMATIVKKQAPALKYLEEVRQHMSRLPSIDPNTRTLLLCGCPNAGKSSFINLLTRADVEVQPYAFTTKSLYIGHMDYEYLRWQIIDTPGILDRSFDEMNTIELQAITALAHIRAAILFFVDISEQCNIPIDHQLKIYDSIKPLFANKPLFMVCNKTDIMSLKDLEEQFPEKRKMIADIEKDGVPVFEVSTLTQDGVLNLRKEACDKLLLQRVDAKLRSKKTENILNRIHVALPKKRDNTERPPFYPPGALKTDEEKEKDALLPKPKLEKDLVEDLDIDYILDLNKSKLLENDDWKYDILPQIINGHNVADFVDVDVLKKLKRLQQREQERLKAGIYDAEPEPYTEEELKILSLGKQISDTLIVKAINHRIDNSNNKRPFSRLSNKRTRERSVSRLRQNLSNLGVDMSDTKDAHFTKADRSRSISRRPIKKARTDSEGRVRSSSKTPRDQSGMRDASAVAKVKKIEKKAVKRLQRTGRKAESDRQIDDMKPKHLYAGKRGIGKTDRR